ncbi:hypothetical protein HON36_02495 [Candidatus Parcubacteria bacterium]|jgi:uncharacterized membrane protein|nr:hypothetical protein [Candidatus Parcubacteria bacterium]MBT7228002.1 hypothetical protein [Candidatus Parcubacteria bacterium]
MFGAVLIIVGVYFLLKNAGIIEGDFWNYLWPILIILLGLSMADKKKKKKNFDSFWCKVKNKKNIVDEQ